MLAKTAKGTEVSVDFMPDCEENEGGLNADEPKRKDLEQLKRICKNY